VCYNQGCILWYYYSLMALQTENKSNLLISTMYHGFTDNNNCLYRFLLEINNIFKPACHLKIVSCLLSNYKKSQNS
jgi:hypothetical protein